MALRPVVLAGNWKMCKTQQEARSFLKEFLPLVLPDRLNETILCVPYTCLGCLTDAPIHLGAQNIHWADAGAYTGEISGSMLVDWGVRYVIVGHSERRQYFGETDETVNLRLKAAQKFGLTPILCVGETKQQRDQGLAEHVIFDQLAQGLMGVDQTKLVIAYEPIWAIGTGDTCETSEAARIIGLIRSKLATPLVPIQYGGSVKPALIDEIMAQPEIDGVLVGGASLEAASFARIVNYQR